MTQRIAIICAALATVATAAHGQGQPAAEARPAAHAVPDGADGAVRRAVLDYCEAFYENKPEYLQRSVDRGLNKFGYGRRRNGALEKFTMTFDEALDLARTYKRRDPNGPKQVRVLDVQERIACAMLTAEWGVDYLNLHKVDGNWKVVQVLWQSPAQAQAARQSEAAPDAADKASGAPSFVQAAQPAAPPADAAPLTPDEQRRYDAVAAELVRALNAEDKKAYRALHTDEGWDSAIDWWRDMFAAQRAKFGSIVRA